MALSPDLQKLSVGKNEVTFGYITGTVIAEKVWSETHVSSSGGGGFVGRQGGYVSAPSIHSRTTTWRELWLKDHAGNEHPLKLANMALSVREGQTVTGCWGTRDGAASGEYLLLINHSAGQHEVLQAGCVRLLSHKGRQFIAALAFLVLLLGVLPLAVAKGGPVLWLIAGALAAFLVRTVQGFNQGHSLLQTHLERIRATVLEQPS